MSAAVSLHLQQLKLLTSSSAIGRPLAAWKEILVEVETTRAFGS